MLDEVSAFFLHFSFEDEVGSRQNRSEERNRSRVLHHAPHIHHPALEQAPLFIDRMVNTF